MDQVSRHEALRGLALALTDAAEFTAGIATLDDAVEALSTLRSKSLGFRIRLLDAKNLCLRAYCLRQLGHHDEAMRAYEKAIELLRHEDDTDERCKLLRGLANCFTTIRDWARARVFFDEARQLASCLPDERKRFNIGRIDCDFAILEMQSGNLEQAQLFNRAGVEAMRVSGDVWNQQIASLNQCGIELAVNSDAALQRDKIQAMIPLLVQLESVVALRAARKNIDLLATKSAAEPVQDWWSFVELT
jgi:tetratricopeptide (TPR) repeat protein